MRVLHLVNDSSYGSAASVAQTARALAALGVEVEVASFSRASTPAAARLEQELASSAVRWKAIPLPEHSRWVRPRLVVRWRDLPAVTRAMDAGRFDLLHSHDLFAGFYASVAGRRAGVPVVATHHGEVGHPLYIRLYEGLYRLWSRRFVRIGVPSAAFLERLAPWVGRARLVQIANGLDVRSWERRLAAARDLRAELGLPPDRFVLGASARLSPEKGQRVTLDAFARLPSALRSGASLLIAGEGALRDRLVAQAARLRLTERIHFLGYRDDMLPFWRTVNLLLHPSFNENSPMNILEAMASEVPVVASMVGEIPTMLAEGAGVLVPPGNPRALAEALTRLAGDPAWRRRLATRGRRRVEERYDSATVARRHIQELYQPALETAEAGFRRPPGAVRGRLRATAGAALGLAPVRGTLPTLAARALPVLCYHQVCEDGESIPYDPRLAITVGRLAQHLDVLQSHFELVTASELGERARDARTSRRPLAALTFDDAYASAAELVAPLLERRGVPATFFVNSAVLDGGGPLWPDQLAALARALPCESLAAAIETAGEGALRERLLTVVRRPGVEAAERARCLVGVAMTSSAQDVLALVARLGGILDDQLPAAARPRHLTTEQLRRFADAGFEIGGHSLDHPVLTRLPASELRRQIAEDRRHLEAIIGRPPVSFAYPFGQWDEQAAALVDEAGYRWGFAVETGIGGPEGPATALPRVLASGLTAQVAGDRFSPGLFLAEIIGFARRLRRAPKR